MNEQSHITVRRTTNYADRLREYKILLDGTPVETVRAGQSVTFPVIAGRHSIFMRIDWCGSEEIPFEVQTGEHITFECGSNLAGWRVFLSLLYILFWPQDYLWLRKAD